MQLIDRKAATKANHQRGSCELHPTLRGTHGAASLKALAAASAAAEDPASVSQGTMNAANCTASIEAGAICCAHCTLRRSSHRAELAPQASLRRWQDRQGHAVHDDTLAIKPAASRQSPHAVRAIPSPSCAHSRRNHGVKVSGARGYRDFKRPFRLVCRAGGGRATAASGADWGLRAGFVPGGVALARGLKPSRACFRRRASASLRGRCRIVLSCGFRRGRPARRASRSRSLSRAGMRHRRCAA